MHTFTHAFPWAGSSPALLLTRRPTTIAGCSVERTRGTRGPGCFRILSPICNRSKRLHPNLRQPELRVCLNYRATLRGDFSPLSIFNIHKHTHWRAQPAPWASATCVPPHATSHGETHVTCWDQSPRGLWKSHFQLEQRAPSCEERAALCHQGRNSGATIRRLNQLRSFDRWSKVMIYWASSRLWSPAFLIQTQFRFFCFFSYAATEGHYSKWSK